MASSGIDFYYMPESPPCRAVEMTANIVNANLVKRYINLFTREHLQEEYTKINPMRKVPFIIDGELRMNESRAINSYLADKYLTADNTYYPKDLVQRARVNELLYLDSSLFNAGSKLLRPLLLGPVKELDPEAEKGFRDFLAVLDGRLGANGGNKFMLGDDLTLGDVSFAATLSFPEACGFDMSQYKHLIAYKENLKAAIPKYSEINDAPLENMKKFVQSRQAGQ